MEQMEKDTSAIGTEIYDSTMSCLQRFRNCMESSILQNHQIIEALEQRFKVWARYSGARSRPALSLDARLEALLDIKTATLKLLNLIITQLDEALLLPKEGSQSTDVNEDGSTIRSTPSLLMDNLDSDQDWESYSGSTWETISLAINMLLETASVIRDESSRSRQSQAPTDYIRPDDVYFNEILQVLTRRQFPNARPSLRNHVARSVFIRRRRILWHQSHVAKLNFPRQYLENTQSSTTLPIDRSFATENLLSTSEPRNNDWRPSGPAPSSTNFSRPPGSSTIRRKLKAPTEVSGMIKGAVDEDRFDFEYPDPPVALEGQEHVTCPYCDKPLLKSKLRDELWRQHVDKDLQPLVCISEKCQDTLKFFTSKSKWVNHMRENHGQDWHRTIHMKTWLCNINDAENEEFTDIESFRKHLSSHGLSEIRINVMTRHNCGVGQRALGTCPFCEAKPIKNQSENPSLDDLNNHIASHISNIALLALPAPDVPNAGDLEENLADTKTATSMALQISLPSEPDIKLPMKPSSRKDFRIAIICALSIEAEMVEIMLDIDWSDEGIKYGKSPGDQNAYTTGVIAGHNVVLAYSPGLGSLSTVVTIAGLMASFKMIKVVFVVGICGVVPVHPETQENIFLGDCIIGTELVQYDLGRQYPNGLGGKIEVEDNLKTADPTLRSLLAKLIVPANRQNLNKQLEIDLERTLNNELDIVRPNITTDRLYQSSYIHSHTDSTGPCDRCLPDLGICSRDCESIGCKDDFLVLRDKPVIPQPKVHLGRFATSGTVLKSGEHRDAIAHSNNVVAFEMDSYDISNVVPTIIIKSACDYADSHKNKKWQTYAAATAAAGLKAVLRELELPESKSVTTRVESTPPSSSSNDVGLAKIAQRSHRQNMPRFAPDEAVVYQNRSYMILYREWDSDSNTWFYSLMGANGMPHERRVEETNLMKR